MTTHELARKLLEGPDLMAIVSGYEGGVDEIQQVAEPILIHTNVNEGWYYGKHEQCSNAKHGVTNYCFGCNSGNIATVLAIHIG